MNVQGCYVSSYAIQGVEVAHLTTQWQRKHPEYQPQFSQRQASLPDVLTTRFRPLNGMVAVHKAMRSSVHDVVRLHTD